ncbi:hypothetical protein HYPSUDRAFT_42804 [Hypholoma sublateritium FD-334 SS-4]|uniref:Zn(2)-C6 fungal-type domain-containing protein n=1 Tax=Hypholoma sublateritium (strain FD-334 SS-4) TaxID=945553 RepID=A0A0D2NW75_HYPSF|nr:hypothetical protein HYPSUDRAFT_42804 [Hypholoma sublateritium FD-334 SS-4]
MVSDNEDNERGTRSTLPKSKKRRLNGACDACRRRRTKCDSAQMGGEGCTYCQSVDIKCTHDMPRKQTKSELTAAYIEALEKKVERADMMYRLLQKIYPGQDIDQLLDTLTAEFADYTGSGVLSEKELSPRLDFNYPIPKTLPGDTSASKLLSVETPDEGTEEDDISHIALSNHLDQLLRITESPLDIYFGPASSFMFFKHCSDLKAEITGLKADGSKFRRPSFWYSQPWEVDYARANVPRYVYPNERLLHDLVALYFDKVNPFMPLLHRPTFLKMLYEKQHHQDIPFGTTVLMVCALGARYSQDPQVTLPGDESGLSAGWQYFRQIPLHPDGFQHIPVLYNMQYYCLAHVYLTSSSVPHVAWNILGIAIKYAIAKGAHRRKSTAQKPSKDEELIKRAFWCLVFLDRLSSAFTGRPCTIADEDFDLEYPIECDDEYWETDNPEHAFKQPPGKPCAITSFVYMLKLLVIMTFSYRTLYSTKKTKQLSGLVDDGWEQRIVAQLDSSMNQWKDSLPDFLRWDPEKADLVIFHQSVHLHIAYSYIQIQIHRPFLTRKSPLSFASLAICTNAARSCAHFLEVGMTRGIKASPLLMLSVVTAGLVISLNLWGSRRSGLIRNPTKEIENFKTCVNFLKESEKRWPVAGRSNDLLAQVSFSSKDYQETHNKRRRDSSGATNQFPTSESLQTDNHYPSFKLASMPLNASNPPVNAASGFSDWDILLMQLGYVPSDLVSSSNQGPGGLPMDYTTPPSLYPSSAYHINNTTSPPDAAGSYEQVPQFSTPEDVFSLWSDIPCAFSQDEWDIYLTYLGNTSYSYQPVAMPLNS